MGYDLTQKNHNLKKKTKKASNNVKSWNHDFDFSMGYDFGLTLNLKFNHNCNLKLNLNANSKEYPNLKL